MAKKKKSKKSQADWPSAASGETDSDIELPRREAFAMPAGLGQGFQSMVSVPIAQVEHLDVETVASLLNSHSQLANVQLSIRYADGRTLFEARPPNPKKGKEREVPLRLPSDDALNLVGALPKKDLALISEVIERMARARIASGARLHALDSERKRLSLFFDFSEKVCQLAALDDVIDRFLGDVTRILEAREGTFFALDRRKKDLYIRCHHGSRPEVVKDFRLKIGEGIAGAVAEDGRPRIINDVERCDDYVEKNNPIRNIICAPVAVRGRLIGVINVNDRADGERPFSNRDLELLVSLARLGGVALDNAKLYDEVRGLLLSTVESLTSAIDAKDEFALGHSRRVAFLCSSIAKRLELDEQDIDLLQIAAMLHDIGNLGIPEGILQKPGALDEKERALIREHPTLGASILSPVSQLSAVLPGIVDHHERYDGRGYPRHLKGEEISTQGRIIAIADTYDAMTHQRPFRAACSAGAALREITVQAGTQFDPVLVPVFVDCFRDLKLDRVAIDDLLPPTGRELDF